MFFEMGKEREKEKIKYKIPLLASPVCCTCRKMPSADRVIFRGAHEPNC